MTATAPLARLASGLALLAALPAARANDQVLPTQTSNLQGFPQQDQITLPRFDPSLGILQCVDVQVDTTVTGQYGLENTSSLDCLLSTDMVVSISLLDPANVTQPLVSCSIAGGARDQLVEEFDQIIDCDGESGISFPADLSGSCGGLQVCGPDMDLFVGTAGNPGTVTLGLLGAFNSQAGGSPCFPQTCSDVDGVIDVTVTYRYVTGEPDVLTTSEDQRGFVSAFDNDCLASGCAGTGCGCALDASTTELVDAPQHGQAIHLGLGVFEYRPDPDTCGTDVFTYRVADGTGTFTPPIAVNVTVDPVNDCPVAVPDTASVAEDSSVPIPVLANDTDVDANDCGDLIDRSTLVIVTPPAHGTAQPQPNGRVRYTPNPGYCGPDSFGYRVSDGTCESNEAQVTVDVQPVNDPPTTADDAGAVAEGGSVVIDVLANDADPDAGTGCGGDLDPTTVTVVNGPAFGTAVPQSDGTVLYTAPLGQCGSVSFTYRVYDTAGARSTNAEVVVNVSAVNEPPVAVADAANTVEGSGVSIPVTANDTDADGDSGCGAVLDPSSVAIVLAPANGTAVPDGAGGVTYSPADGVCGIDRFEYTVADASGAVSAPAEVTVDVQAENECPTAVDDAWSTDEGAPTAIPVLANDVDPDAGGCGSDIDPTTVTVLSGPSNGGASVNSSGAVVYVPDAGFCGTDTLTYRVSDGECVSPPATVTIDVAPVNECPVAVDDADQTGETLAVTIPVAANDTDVDDASGCGGGLVAGSVQIELAPANGTAVPDGAGGVTYTPADGFCGDDSFRYSIADADGCRSEAADVTVTVVPINAPPDAAPDSAVTPEDTPALVLVLDNDIDPDEISGCGGGIDPTTVEIVTAPTHGTAVPDGAGGVLYTPDADFCGTDQAWYRVADEDGEFSSLAVIDLKVTRRNDCPVAAPDVAATDEDLPVLIDVLANDTDADDGTVCGSPLGMNVQIETPAASGTLALDPSGAVLYTPDADFCGQDAFQYSAVDEGGCVSDPVTVQIDVAPRNDCPTAVDDQFTLDEGETALLDVLANDTDPDDEAGCGDGIDPTSVSVIDEPSRGDVTVQPDGRVRYVGHEDQCGPDSFRYAVLDDAGCLSNEAVVTIDIEPVNAPPVALSDFARSKEGAAIVVDVVKSGTREADYDPDDGSSCGASLDPCSVQLVKAVPGELTLGTVVQTDCGYFRYTPNEEPPVGQTLIDTFRYTISDDDGLESDPATVTIELLGEDPFPPLCNDDVAATDFPDPVEIDVLANDEDPNDDLLPGTLTIVEQPDCGEVMVLGGGIVEFTPIDGACGECEFVYEVEDETGLSAQATVRVEVFCECASGPRDRRRPGSLLLYPQYDSREGSLTFITVTNTDRTNAVDVKYEYVRGEDCVRFDRTQHLTPNDTLTVIADAHHPDSEQGFLYLFAQDPDTGRPIVHNRLIGQVLIVDGVAQDGLEVNAVSFQGVGPQGMLTDLDADGVRDLDGLEYEQAPGEILIPRFLAQTPGVVGSELILVALTGGKEFTTTLDFLIYNDNEVEFSRDFTFRCWTRFPLVELSQATNQDFLEITDNDPEEIVGLNGAREAGWIRISGALSQSLTTVVEDPAFYAVLTERASQGSASSDLPFETCTKDNGALLPGGLQGDVD